MIQDTIFDIEKHYSLYKYEVNGVSVWDGIRYDVIAYITAQGINDRSTKNGKQSINTLLSFFVACIAEIRTYISLIILPRKKRDYLLFISSRYHNGKNSFDRQVFPVLREIPQKRRTIIEFQTGAKYSDPHYADAAPLYFRLHNKSFKISIECAENISSIINEGFGHFVISKEIIQSFIRRFLSNNTYYLLLFKRIQPKKIIVSHGRFKSICFAANQLNIPVVLFQHALIFEDDFALANTCPNRSMGHFPNKLLTYGSYWGGYMKKLVDVSVVGNMFLSHRIEGKAGDSILVISTAQQGLFLSPVINSFARSNPGINVIYRLHPAEFCLKEKYEDLFRGCGNVLIMKDELSLEESIAQCRVVVGIFSTALFEALHNNRIVAVLEELKYQTYESHLKGLDNVYFFKDANELSLLVNIKAVQSRVTFFEPLNESVLQESITI